MKNVKNNLNRMYAKEIDSDGSELTSQDIPL